MLVAAVTTRHQFGSQPVHPAGECPCINLEKLGEPASAAFQVLAIGRIVLQDQPALIRLQRFHAGNETLDPTQTVDSLQRRHLRAWSPAHKTLIVNKLDGSILSRFLHLQITRYADNELMNVSDLVGIGLSGHLVQCLVGKFLSLLGVLTPNEKPYQLFAKAFVGFCGPERIGIKPRQEAAEVLRLDLALSA